MGGGDNQDMQAMRQRFEKIRDSIQAAHGGNLSREELMQEMQRLRASRQQTVTQSEHLAKPPANRYRGSKKFGITVRYPEYEKSPYVPSHESGRARIWVLTAQGKMEPIMVVTGVTDGRFTEITTDQLKPGDQIVLGVMSNDQQADSRSPFTSPTGGMRPMGGMR